MISFGELIRDARKAAGLTLDETAKRLGTHKGYISGIERGKVSPPSAKYIPKIAKMFDLPEVSLLALAHAEKSPKKVREFFLSNVEREMFPMAPQVSPPPAPEVVQG